MPVSKVNSNYQLTIPKEARGKPKIERGDKVLVEFDEDEGPVLERLKWQSNPQVAPPQPVALRSPP